MLKPKPQLCQYCGHTVFYTKNGYGYKVRFCNKCGKEYEIIWDELKKQEV